MNNPSHLNRVVVIGSVGFDRIMTLPNLISDFIIPDQLFKLNVSFTVNSLRNEYGGTGGNCAYGLGLLQKKPILISAFGHDSTLYRQHLLTQQINLKYCHIDEKVACAVGNVMTDTANNQIWMYYPGALSKCSLINISAIIKPSDLVVLMPNHLKAFTNNLHELIKHDNTFIFDPAFFIPNLTINELSLGIKHAYIIIGNEYEISLLENKTHSKRANWLNNNNVVIETKGVQGVVVLTKNHQWKIPAAKTKRVVDPTGAGDAFRAGLAAGLIQGKTLELSIKMGLVTAAFCVENLGTQTYKYTMTEYWERFKQNYGT